MDEQAHERPEPPDEPANDDPGSDSPVSGPPLADVPPVAGGTDDSPPAQGEGESDSW